MNIITIVYALLLVALVFITNHAFERASRLKRERDAAVEQRELTEQEMKGVQIEFEERLAKEREIAKRVAGLVDEAKTAYRAEMEAWQATRNVAWTKPAKRMPSYEVRRAFAVAEDAPLWLALNQEIDDFLQDALDQVSLPPAATMTEEARLHLAGGVEHVRLFHKRLLELHAAAQKVDADLEAEAPKGGAA